MNITLSDIAKKTGVTISTVQRALNGGGGVSEEKRRLIQSVAMEMGYTRNYYASSLRRGDMRVAVVFPNTASQNRFYGHYLWTGIHRFANESAAHNIELIKLIYDRSPEDHTLCLQELLDGQHGRVDGIVTRGAVSREIVVQFREFHERNIPVVLAGSDTRHKYRLCCVKSYEQMAGSLAADMLLSFGVLDARSQFIVCGNFSGLNQFTNAQGFERELYESGLKPEIFKVSSDIDPEKTRDSIREILLNNKNVRAIYACSARSTPSACEAVKEAGFEGKVRVIGSDLFEESIELLRKGQVNALIHNRPVTVAYRSIEILVSYLASNKKPINDTVLVDSAIVMRGNLDFYLRDISGLQKFADPDRASLFDDGFQIYGAI